jgi:hypothetical protein
VGETVVAYFKVLPSLQGGGIKEIQVKPQYSVLTWRNKVTILTFYVNLLMQPVPMWISDGQILLVAYHSGRAV